MAAQWALEEVDTREMPRNEMIRRMEHDFAGLRLTPRCVRIIYSLFCASDLARIWLRIWLASGSMVSEENAAIL